MLTAHPRSSVGWNSLGRLHGMGYCPATAVKPCFSGQINTRWRLRTKT